MGNDLSNKNKKQSNDYMPNNKINTYSSKGNKTFDRGAKIKSNITNSNLFYYEFVRNITFDSYSFGVDNSMIVFKSINDILYFIYSNKKYSIISYNLIDNKKINDIKNAHDSIITNFRHYFYKDKKQDLIISTSTNNNVKLWRINDWECLLNIERVNKDGNLLSACFLIQNNQINILTSNDLGYESIKVFNLNGNKIKEINNSKDRTNYIDVYYDNHNYSSKFYILTANHNFVKSYDYNDNTIYHIYNDYDKVSHNSLRIKNESNLIKLIESSEDGNIRIWNFHTGELLNKIFIYLFLNGIYLWENDYLFVGSGDKTINILDLKKSKVIVI